MSERVRAGPSPARARPSLTLEALMEARPGLAGRQAKEEMAVVEGPDLLWGGQPGPQPVPPGSPTVPTRPLPSREALSGFPAAAGPSSPQLTWAVWIQGYSR